MWAQKTRQQIILKRQMGLTWPGSVPWVQQKMRVRLSQWRIDPAAGTILVMAAHMHIVHVFLLMRVDQPCLRVPPPHMAYPVNNFDIMHLISKCPILEPLKH